MSLYVSVSINRSKPSTIVITVIVSPYNCRGAIDREAGTLAILFLLKWAESKQAAHVPSKFKSIIARFKVHPFVFGCCKPSKHVGRPKGNRSNSCAQLDARVRILQIYVCPVGVSPQLLHMQGVMRQHRDRLCHGRRVLQE